MHVALAFDQNYLPHARVLIESILHRSPGHLVFWLLLGDDVGEQDAREVAVQVGARGRVELLHPPDVTALPLSVRPTVRHVSRAMYLRLHLPALLPPDVARVVYLDSDMLCTSSILPLGRVSLRRNIIGAVRDLYTRRLVDTNGLPGLQSSGLEPQADYFNSGVLVIDTAAWRKAHITARALAYAAAHTQDARFPDQDALNFALYRRWRRLPHRWNTMSSWRLEPAFGGDPSCASLVHGVGDSRKFWLPDYPKDSVFRERYWAYRRQCGIE